MNNETKEFEPTLTNTTWWGQDWSEELTILALVALGICSLIWLGLKAETIISTIVGGFLGYLIRNRKSSSD